MIITYALRRVVLRTRENGRKKVILIWITIQYTAVPYACSFIVVWLHRGDAYALFSIPVTLGVQELQRNEWNENKQTNKWNNEKQMPTTSSAERSLINHFFRFENEPYTSKLHTHPYNTSTQLYRL